MNLVSVNLTSLLVSETASSSSFQGSATGFFLILANLDRYHFWCNQYKSLKFCPHASTRLASFPGGTLGSLRSNMLVGSLLKVSLDPEFRIKSS